MENPKGFFYNPQFRMGIYLWAWIFLGPVLLLATVIPKIDGIVCKYKEGHTGVPALLISVLGALIVESVLLLVGNFHLQWVPSDLFLIVALYIAGTLLGWLSLAKIMYYDLEGS